MIVAKIYVETFQFTDSKGIDLRMALSLKVTVAMAIIKHNNWRLNNLLISVHQPRNDEDFLISQTANQDDFWMQVAKAYLPQLLILSRLDIKFFDWKTHLELYETYLHSGYTFVGQPIPHTSQVHGRPVLIYTGKSPFKRRRVPMEDFDPMDPQDVVYLEFYIRGLAPSPGAIGFVIKVESLCSSDQSDVFLCQNTDQLPLAFDRLLDMISTSVMYLCQGIFVRKRIKLIRLAGKNFNMPPSIEEIKIVLNKHFNTTVKMVEFADTGELQLITRAIVAVNPLDHNQEYLRLYVTLAQLRF